MTGKGCEYKYNGQYNAAKNDDPEGAADFAKSARRGTGVRVLVSGRGRRSREGNDERIDELNGQGNDQGMGGSQ
ncbi:hypothetical protein Tco_0201079 [Tanacetum coccineum]